jgi:hypothetical protein
MTSLAVVEDLEVLEDRVVPGQPWPVGVTLSPDIEIARASLRDTARGLAGRAGGRPRSAARADHDGAAD